MVILCKSCFFSFAYLKSASKLLKNPSQTMKTAFNQQSVTWPPVNYNHL